ncbi:aromatase-like [Antedon mediterranea]|uniref:aromatase-like n=1 Tax=Antedon mediterranea TaxID=105859 RepID=UPI003AF6B0A8
MSSVHHSRLNQCLCEDEREKGKSAGPARNYGLGAFLSNLRFLYFGIPGAASYYNKQFGDVVRVWIAGEPTYLITRPSAAWYILKTNGNNYCKRFGNDTGLNHIGMFKSGIIWNNDVEGWKTQRAFFQRALNADSLNRASSITIDATNRQIARIGDFQTRAADRRIDGLNFIRRITLDVTNILMLGVQVDDDEDLVDRIVQYFKAWEYFLINPSLYYWMTSSEYKKHVRSIDRLNEAIDSMIEKKRASLVDLQKGDNPLPSDFSTKLIEAEKRGEITTNNVRQCILEMLLAGTDTSSVTMYYLLVSVASNPDVEKRILEEIDQVVGDRNPVKGDLPKLIYLEQALKESMRYKPVGPVIMRRAIDDDVIEGIEISKGTNIILNLADMHRRPDIFKNPNEFDPENFSKKLDQEQFVPFGTGPKGCIGQFLAMVEMKVFFCVFLRGYRVINSVGKSLNEIETRWDIAQQPTGESFMYFVERDQKPDITGPQSDE